MLFINVVYHKHPVFTKSTVTYSNVLGLSLHSLTANSMMHPEQIRLEASFMVNALYSCTFFNLLYHMFTVPFLCLDTEILSTMLSLPTVFSW